MPITEHHWESMGKMPLRALGCCAPSTFFKKTPRGRHVNAIGNVAHDTFMHAAKKTFFQLDHFTVMHWDRRKRALDCGAVNHGLESDHRMIMMRLRITVRTAEPCKVVNRDMLRDPETRRKVQRSRQRLHQGKGRAATRRIYPAGNAARGNDGSGQGHHHDQEQTKTDLVRSRRIEAFTNHPRQECMQEQPPPNVKGCQG